MNVPLTKSIGSFRMAEKPWVPAGNEGKDMTVFMVLDASSENLGQFLENEAGCCRGSGNTFHKHFTFGTPGGLNFAESLIFSCLFSHVFTNTVRNQTRLWEHNLQLVCLKCFNIFSECFLPKIDRFAASFASCRNIQEDLDTFKACL